jgi:hypothetical protein
MAIVPISRLLLAKARLTCLTSISVNPARDHKQCAIVSVQDEWKHGLGGVA